VTDEVLIGREGACGIVTLNRPRAINALSMEMIDTIYAALLDWRQDETVSAVLFEGTGERGFCAGGDVRACRTKILDGEVAEALDFYDHEYANNELIATYPKRIVAIGHGIVMGGGIGLAGHAGIRVAVEGAKYAMPETAIGLFPDVGVNALLARVPAHRALLFEFLGTPVGPADAIALDLTDLVVSQAAVAELRAAVIAAAGAGREALGEAVARFAADAGEAVFCATADRLAPAFTGRTAGEIIAAIGEMAGASEATLVETLGKRCPTSLEAALMNYRLAQANPDIAAVLALDLRLAHYLSVRGDFAEGVRAVLVDKNDSPVWSPASAAEVDRDALTAVLLPS
jgi:enoyl-CoA hydratase